MVEYEASVDIDGDGDWDDVSVTDNADGSVTLEGDVDGDGRTDFVGYDLDADGLVDHADYDTDRDGEVDTRWTDHDGDGWLDSSHPIVDDDTARATPDAATSDGIRSKAVPAPGA
jgi:hypothetical protein